MKKGARRQGTGMMNAIETRALTKRYGKARGIEQLSIAVPEGALFGFIGPNGAGKSTTIRVLLGLLRPTEGEALLLGHLVDARSAGLRAQVGYAPGEVRYYDGMSVRELLDYAAALYRTDCRARRDELIARFSLDPTRKIEDLSLGNKKKVALVQALQHRPRVLILDEPTNGLDPLMQEQLYTTLEEEHARGTTIFFSSHIMSEVQRLCQSVAIVRAGRLVAVERVEDLRQRAWRRVRLTHAQAPSEALAKLPGLRERQTEGGQTRFLYQGAPGPLLAALAQEQLLDTLIEEPALEEIVMGYYRDEAAR